MLANSTYIQPLTIIRRERILPTLGHLLSRQGQEVSPRDVIAEANLTPEHLLLDIAGGLGIPAEETTSLIKVQPGDEIVAKDIIAGPIGFMRRTIRAPSSGRVVLVGDGQVLLELETPLFKLRAGYPGIVEQLIPGRGAVIITTCTLIQGVWGNGQIDFGLLHNLMKKPDDMLTADRIDLGQRSTIVLGGYCNNAEVLLKAAKIPLRALILSSMSSKLIDMASESPLPVLVLEGFGQRTLNMLAFELLSKNQDIEITVNAQTNDHFEGTRPEVVIPVATSNQSVSPPGFAEFAPGKQIRVISPPQASPIGTIERLHLNPMILPNGIQAPAARILLTNNERLLIPLANLEVVG